MKCFEQTLVGALSSTSRAYNDLKENPRSFDAWNDEGEPINCLTRQVELALKHLEKAWVYYNESPAHSREQHKHCVDSGQNCKGCCLA